MRLLYNSVLPLRWRPVFYSALADCLLTASEAFGLAVTTHERSDVSEEAQ